MDTRKPMFFYSNFCTFSEEALKLMQRHGLTGKFTLVCIEKRGRTPLPPMVDRVPMIVGPNFVFKDEALFDHLESLSSRRAAGGGGAVGEVSAFQISSSLNTDAFHPSFQDERVADITMLSPNQILQGDVLTRCTGMEEAFAQPAMHDMTRLEAAGGGLGHIQDAAIEQMMAQRAADVAALFGTQRA